MQGGAGEREQPSCPRTEEMHLNEGRKLEQCKGSLRSGQRDWVALVCCGNGSAEGCSAARSASKQLKLDGRQDLRSFLTAFGRLTACSGGVGKRMG
mmetsp:Transcript_11349/g.21772  ORF Transcript_11349/g.21772 Transcript_11349/m.21772 type:complete len:96 (-) Transcript_11349:361-648(-)